MSGWRVRCRFQTSRLIDLAGQEKIFSIDGREAVLRAHHRGDLNQSHHFYIEVRRLAFEAEAMTFAKRIKDAMLLSSIVADFGIFFDKNSYFDVKYISPSSLPSPELYAEATVGQNPTAFFAAFEVALSSGKTFPGSLEAATEIYCASTVDPSPIASLILAMSCIEELVKVDGRRERPEEEKALLNDAISHIEKTIPPEPNNKEIIEAFERAKKAVINSIRGNIKQKPIRRSGKEMLARYIPYREEQFDVLNSKRGGAAHHYGDRMKTMESAKEAQQLAKGLLILFIKNGQGS